MHQALEAFLTEVWHGRTNIPSHQEHAARYIYDTWYAVRPSANNVSPSFDQSIRDLINNSPGVTLEVQGNDEFFHAIRRIGSKARASSRCDFACM
jgi:hypothetical protein